MFGPKVNFLMSVYYNFSKTPIFGVPSSTPGVDRDTHPPEFFVENLLPRNFCLKHFLIESVLFAAFSPKVNFLLSVHCMCMRSHHSDFYNHISSYHLFINNFKILKNSTTLRVLMLKYIVGELGQTQNQRSRRFPM